jgi:hypothetical protein
MLKSFELVEEARSICIWGLADKIATLSVLGMFSSCVIAGTVVSWGSVDM